MEQNMKFGLILGWLAILKKMGANYEQLLRSFFSCFQGQKNVNLFYKHCRVGTKKFHNTYLFYKIFKKNQLKKITKNRLNIHNQFCIALLRDTSLCDFYVMTLITAKHFFKRSNLGRLLGN